MGKKTLFTSIAIGTIIVLAIGLRIAFFHISTSNVPASADEALSVLQAKQILRGHLPLLVMANTYQFPVESYMNVPFVKLLPRTAFGARLIPFLICLISMAVFIAILLKLAPIDKTWPGILLFLFPSAYLAMLFSAYAIPQHSSFMLLSALAIFASIYQYNSDKHKFQLALLAGFLSGLAFSNHLLAIPVVAVLLALSCLNRKKEYSLKSTLGFVSGLITGMAPYFLAKKIFPGAYSAVTQSDTITRAIAKIWSPTMKFTLPHAFGINPCLFPDGKETVPVLPGLEIYFSITWVAILLVVIVTRIGPFVKRISDEKWISFTPDDIFAGISLISLLLFVLNKRSQSDSYRYLLPMLWAFPFLIAYLYTKANKPFRYLIACYTVSLVAFNIFATTKLMDCWAAPEFAKKCANIADIEPAIEYLKEQGINKCYASYWAAYRIDFETDEQILCSQPINERFPGWNTPYKDEVIKSTNPAFVLTDGIRFLKPAIFERHLKTMHIACDTKVQRGDYYIYHNFHKMEVHENAGELLKSKCLAASYNNSTLYKLTDGNKEDRWTTNKLQEKGMWLEVGFPSVSTINRIRLFYGNYYHDRAPEISIEALTGDGWKEITHKDSKQLDKFIFKHGNIIYGDGLQTIPLPETNCTELRLSITKPNPRQSWTMTEIQVFGRSE